MNLKRQFLIKPTHDRCVPQGVRSAWACAREETTSSELPYKHTQYGLICYHTSHRARLRTQVCTFVFRMQQSQVFFRRDLQNVIWLSWCPCWSESSLGAHRPNPDLNLLRSGSMFAVLLHYWINRQPRREKTSLWGLGPGQAQTQLAQLQRLDWILPLLFTYNNAIFNGSRGQICEWYL